MPRITRIEAAQSKIESYFNQSPVKVFTSVDLTNILKEHHKQWNLAVGQKAWDFIAHLKKLGLKEVGLKSSTYKDLIRYTWQSQSDFTVAAGVFRNVYLSYWTASFLHGLTNEIPKLIFVNREQSPKPPPNKPLTQNSIDAAFRRPPRDSKYVFQFRGKRLVIVSGKFTGGLEVTPISGPQSEALRATSLERTLVDISVRPHYAGGPYEVLRCFEAARDRVSSNGILATLRKLDYVYPYHQAIGFYLERAGYRDTAISLFRNIPRNLDFYLARGIKDPEYDSTWRISFPKGL